MGVATHLGIELREYDARIRTFIPFYEEMLDVAAGVLADARRSAPVILDLGIGTGALSARCLAAVPRARIIGTDTDPAILAVARRRLGRRLTAVTGDFVSAPLPRCDVVTASLALHHVRTRPVKAALYAKCFAALRPGGLLINVDCCLASSPWLQAQDRRAWRAHLERTYTRQGAVGLLRAWASEDVYFSLEDEVDLLRRAGFAVDVTWRRHCFAVIVAAKPAKSRRDRPNRRAGASDIHRPRAADSPRG